MFLGQNSSTIYCMCWADLAQGWYFWYSEKPNAPAQARAQHKSSVAMSEKISIIHGPFSRLQYHLHESKHSSAQFMLFFTAYRQLFFSVSNFFHLHTQVQYWVPGDCPHVHLQPFPSMQGCNAHKTWWFAEGRKSCLLSWAVGHNS